MNKTVLAELRKLSFDRGLKSPFPNHVEFQKWADQIMPRLQFDPKLASAFKNAVSTTQVHETLGIDTLGSINEAIGLLNQAIVSLENKVRFETPAAKVVPLQAPSAPPTVEFPSKLTLKWLYEHAPVAFYFWLAALIAATFLLGVAFTETPFYHSIRSYPASAEQTNIIVSPVDIRKGAASNAAK